MDFPSHLLNNVAVNTAQVQLAIMFNYFQTNIKGFSPSKQVFNIKTYAYKNLKLSTV